MSSHRGPRCIHCAQYHGEDVASCPWTGKPLPRGAASGGGVAAPSALPSNVEDEGRALIGKTIGGKYFVRSVLGRGGMGTVYEGVNVQMGRVVALKVLHPKQVKKRESVKRFYQEARAAGAIGHPNICEVYDLGALDDGSPYLVMERLVGSTLAHLARQSVLPFDAAIDIMIQVLSGLVAAHDKGIVHRDLKPDNIFLSERVGCPPIAKVLDFGVSKVVSSAPEAPRDADLDLTRTGMVMGTPYYMSPEQASGARDLDGRVDLYACGVILYETLTGRRPFLAANYHILLWNILKTEPPRPSELRPDLPPMLESVMARAMARDRDARYTTAHEFIAALTHVRASLGQPQAALRPSIPTPAPFAAPPPPPFPPPPPPPPSPIAHAPPPSPRELTPAKPPPLRKGGTMPLASRPSANAAASGQRRGFEDVATEIDGLKDFSSVSDEVDAATTLMGDPDVLLRARALHASLLKGEAAPAPFDPNATEVSKSPPVVDPYNDETRQMTRPPLPKR